VNSEQLEGDLASCTCCCTRSPFARACGCSTKARSPLPLRLISSETFKTGVLNLVYGPAESTHDATYEDAKVHLAQPEE
jgi:hypothetical protein